MSVPVSPDEIASKTFPATLRGYSRTEVDAYMRLLADEQRRLHGRVAELEGLLIAAQEAQRAEEVGPAQEAEEGREAPDGGDSDGGDSELVEMFSRALAEVRAVRGRLGAIV